MPTLQIIVASTRPTRVGIKIAQWFRAQAVAHGAFEIDFADLVEIDLPFLNEPKQPSDGDYVHQHTKGWSARVVNADAFAIVMPEYNRSFNAPLKNALDSLYYEWAHKPVGLISYGGVAGGARAATAIVPTLTTLGMTVMPATITIPFVAKLLDERGELKPSAPMERSAPRMLDELARLAPLTAQLRPASS